MPPEMFDRKRRRALHERAQMRSGDMFLWNTIAKEVGERLALVTRTFDHILFIGPIARWQDQILPGTAADVRHISADEDRLDMTPDQFDLVISAGTLDSVNDVPGALIQIRRVLKPDGLFLGHMFGAGTLAMLKSMMMVAQGEKASAHVHPQIDLRNAADLLARAGFALPVADQDVMPVRYRGWRSIVRDVRDAGAGNALAGPRCFLGRTFLARMDDEWESRSDDQGKVTEYYSHIYMSGWAPSPDQPKPLRRGSGQISLTAILPGSTGGQ